MRELIDQEPLRDFRKKELGEEQAQRIVCDHRELMQRFGYLDENGEIVR